MENLHEKLVEKSLPLMEAYHDDLLIHDKREIEQQYPGRSFIHFTGSTGTHIITLYEITDYPNKDDRVPYLFGSADRWHILEGIKGMCNCMARCNRMSLIQYYNGKTLRTITYEKAKQIVQEYTRKIKAQFN
tara:strand:- start:212 stop:607 length:396 start_codon:yes stop_codon:yes gene_type:complete